MVLAQVERGGAGLDGLCARLIEGGVAPSAAAGWALRRGPGEWDVSVGGATEAFFDLASVTKPLTAVAVARSGLSPEAKLAELLPEARETPTARASLALLLAHRAGLEAHVPLYRAVIEGGAFDRAGAIAEALRSRRADALGDPPPGGFPPLYSDLGYVLVGEAMTRAFDADFDALLDRFVIDPLGLGASLGSARALEARTGGAFRSRVVPTEHVTWRGGEVRGEVHDENAWALAGGGACGHAGTFGTVRAVLAFGAGVLDALGGVGPLAGDLAWLVEERPGGVMRAGFDGKTPQRPAGSDAAPPTGSSLGDEAGPRTFGHLGFTGTSLWIDPDAGVVVSLLTNRVHPTRENTAIREARPQAHDALFRMARAAAGR